MFTAEHHGGGKDASLAGRPNEAVGLPAREADSSPAVEIFHGRWQDGFRQIRDGSVDLVITDPPYGTTALPWDKAPNLPELWRELNRVVKPTGVVISFAAQPFATDLIVSNRKAFRYELIWHKTIAVGFLDAKRRPLRAHENILIFCRKWGAAGNKMASTYNPQMTAGIPYKAHQCHRPVHYHVPNAKPGVKTENFGTRHPRSVQTVSQRSDGKSVHPTQKPLELVEWLIRSYSHPGEFVADPFAGSGTVAVAAKRTGRRGLACEVNDGYYATAVKRLADVK